MSKVTVSLKYMFINLAISNFMLVASSADYCSIAGNLNDPTCPIKARQKEETSVGHFIENGWMVVKNVLPPEFCELYIREKIYPEFKKIEFHEYDPTTWTTGTHREQGFQPYGIMLNLDLELPELFESTKLNNIIDELHGDQPNENAPSTWEYEHGQALWFTHIRYPMGAIDSEKYNASTYSHQITGWHIDGVGDHNAGTKNPNKLTPEHHVYSSASLVVFPVLSGPTPRHGGLTTLLSGSHYETAKLLLRSEPYGVSYIHKFIHAHLQAWFGPEQCRISELPELEAGDVLIMHRLLVHTAAPNYTAMTRIGFNLPIKFKEKNILKEIRATLDAHNSDNVNNPSDRHYDETIFAPVLRPIAKLLTQPEYRQRMHDILHQSASPRTMKQTLWWYFGTPAYQFVIIIVVLIISFVYLIYYLFKEHLRSLASYSDHRFIIFACAIVSAYFQL